MVGIERQNSKHATYFFNCPILLLFTCHFNKSIPEGSCTDDTRVEMLEDVNVPEINEDDECQGAVSGIF